jgi:hypothetical protein
MKKKISLDMQYMFIGFTVKEVRRSNFRRSKVVLFVRSKKRSGDQTTHFL